MNITGKRACIGVSASVGFLTAFWLMQDCTRVSSATTDTLELILRAPSIPLLLIPELLTNHFLSWMEISLATGAAWGLILGAETWLWLKSKYGIRRDLFRVSCGLFAVGGLCIASWILGGILSLPFGICLFAPNLSCITCPSTSTIASETGIDFPAGTRLICSDSSGFQGSHDVAVVLSMPRQGINALRRSLNVHAATSREFPEYDKSRPWFNPSAKGCLECADLKSRTAGGRQSVVQGRIWLSIDVSGRGTVYLSYWGYN